MNAGKVVQEQISDRRGYFRVDLLNLQYQSNCKEKNWDTTLITLSVCFHWRQTALGFSAYRTRTIFGKTSFATSTTRDALFGEIEGCTSQRYHFDTLPGRTDLRCFRATLYLTRIKGVGKGGGKGDTRHGRETCRCYGRTGPASAGIFYNYDRTALRGHLYSGPTRRGVSGHPLPCILQETNHYNPLTFLGEWKGELFAMAEVSISVLWRR